MTNAPSGAVALRLLQELLRFDTSNPPGNERACLEHIATSLAAANVEHRFISSDPQRPNLVARIPGRSRATPLLLYGHVDVVAAVADEWSHPPFSGAIADGFVWGRGAIDMKGGVALMVAAVLAIAEAPEMPLHDVLLVLTSDEEAGSRLGMQFLVEQHPAIFEGVRHAISEVGGMTTYLGGRRVVPVQVAEKQRCVVRATVRGPSGHAASAMRGTASGRLGRLLTALDERRLPVRLTPIVAEIVRALADVAPTGTRELLLRVLVDGETDDALSELGDLGRTLQPLLRNTATATGVGGGIASNVVPSELHVDLDGRLLPGCGPDDLLAEIDGVVPGLATYEITHVEPPAVTSGDLSLLPLLASSLSAYDDAAIAPWMLSGYTDARYVSQLGIQTYGFLPMQVPPEITLDLMHAADERVPVDGLGVGVECLRDVVANYRGT
jgi:acetylornithine deacetylase/succinyl-diaminopimelate desuccinylase-like protein